MQEYYTNPSLISFQQSHRAKKSAVVNEIQPGHELHVAHVWFTVERTGSYIRASVSPTETSRRRDEKVRKIYSRLCGDLKEIRCTSSARSPSFSWLTQLSASHYYILVNGDYGQFELSVVTLVPPNDECTDTSEPLPLDGTVVLRSTALATPESGNMDPSGPDSLTTALWFYIQKSTGHA